MQLALFAPDKPEKPKRVIAKKIDPERRQKFWDKVNQVKATGMSEQQANIIVDNITYWDKNRLEIELDEAGATDGEKDFYLNFFYVFVRKQYKEFEKLYLQ